MIAFDAANDGWPILIPVLAVFKRTRVLFILKCWGNGEKKNSQKIRYTKLQPDSKFGLVLPLCRDVEFMAGKGSGIAASEGKFCVLGDTHLGFSGVSLLLTY